MGRNQSSSAKRNCLFCGKRGQRQHDKKKARAHLFLQFCLPEILEAAPRCKVVSLTRFKLPDEESPHLGTRQEQGDGQGDSGGGIGHPQVQVLPGERTAEVAGQDLGGGRVHPGDGQGSIPTDSGSGLICHIRDEIYPDLTHLYIDNSYPLNEKKNNVKNKNEFKKYKGERSCQRGSYCDVVVVVGVGDTALP